LIAGSKDLRFITSLNDSELDRKSGIKFWFLVFLFWFNESLLAWFNLY
jgi:hypothetical protein